MAGEPAKKASSGESGCAAILLILCVIVYNSFDHSEKFSVGAHCSLARTTYGTKDIVGQSYAEFDKATAAKDELGLADMIERHVVALLPEGTSCLIIDTNFFEHYTPYRRVRILSGWDVGKAFWVKKSDLVAGPSSPQTESKSEPAPPRPATCTDPNEYLGETGNCWCKEGYTRDMTTQKCVPR
jgi:hypothetical protein